MAIGAAYGRAQYEPAELIITDPGTYNVYLTADEIGGGNWEVVNDNPNLDVVIADSSENNCLLEVSSYGYDFAVEFTEFATLEIYNYGGDNNYVYYYTVRIESEGYNLTPTPPAIGGTTGGTTTGGTTTGGTTTDPEEEEEKPYYYIQLSATPQTLHFQKTGNTFGVIIQADKNVYQWSYSSHSYLSIQATTGSTYCNFYVTSIPNDSSANYINTEIVVTAWYDASHQLKGEITIPVSIEGNKIVAVWDNVIYEFPNEMGETVNFKIELDDKIIYAGKAVKSPDADRTNINVTRMVRDYIKNGFSDFNNEKYHLLSDYSKTFKILLDDTPVASYTVYNSWSYSTIPSTMIISMPIRNVIDKRQYFMCSLYNNTNVKQDGNYNVIKTTGTTSYHFYNTSSYQSLICDDMKKYPDVKKVKVDILTFEVKETCADYCLYYTNAYGGWDSLLVNGNVKKTDKITSQYYTKLDGNDYSRTKYFNEIKSGYVLYTDWFTDEEQAKLYHLIESINVYLHDLNTGEIIPVVITNTSCEWKTFTNNGKKKFYNTLNVDVSKEKIRQ